MGNITSGDDCQHPVGSKTSDFFGGVLHGVLGLVGFGDLVNPLGDAQSSVTKALNHINSTTAMMSVATTRASQTEIEWVTKSLNVHLDLISQINAMQTDQLRDEIKQENLFLIILSVLLVLLIFFFLIQKKCC
jgi:dipeptide/tripeptide permease